jgi:hypothetical protein
MKVLDVLSGPLSEILDKFVADKDLKQKLSHELEISLHRANIAQLEVNKTEAAHKSIFVSGWRPFVGWCCGVSLAYHFLVAPFLAFILGFYYPDVTLPEFDFSQLSTILMGMLGLGGLRTFEKMKGVSREK